MIDTTLEREKMQNDQGVFEIALVKLFLIATTFASLMGLAMRLSQGGVVTKKELAQSLFVSFCAGLLIAFFTYDYFVPKGQKLIWFGIVGVAGIGAHSVFDLFFAWIGKVLSTKLGVKAKTRRKRPTGQRPKIGQ
jgi:hypothetical protein